MYGAQMRQSSSLPLLARLRCSQRFAVLMLLVFILRIGADVACTAHDIVEGSAASQGIELSVASVDRDHPAGSPFDVNGACDHCGCHQVAAILPPIPVSVATTGALPIAQRLPLSVPALQSTELRPPIV